MGVEQNHSGNAGKPQVDTTRLNITNSLDCKHGKSDTEKVIDRKNSTSDTPPQHPDCPESTRRGHQFTLIRPRGNNLATSGEKRPETRPGHRRSQCCQKGRCCTYQGVAHTLLWPQVSQLSVFQFSFFNSPFDLLCFILRPISPLPYPGRTSSHVTFAVEVEPHTAWEGLLHLTLHLTTSPNPKVISPPPTPQQLSRESCQTLAEVLLLHVAVRVVGTQDYAWRKACLATCGDKRTAFRRLIQTLGARKGLESVERDRKDKRDCRAFSSHPFATFASVCSAAYALLDSDGQGLEWVAWLHPTDRGDTKSAGKAPSGEENRSLEVTLAAYLGGLREAKAFETAKERYCRNCQAFWELLVELAGRDGGGDSEKKERGLREGDVFRHVEWTHVMDLRKTVCERITAKRRRYCMFVCSLNEEARHNA